MRDSWGWDKDDESWSSPEAADRYAAAVRQAIDDAYKAREAREREAVTATPGSVILGSTTG